MKKRYLVIGLLASSLYGYGQKADTSYRKKALSHTDVQVLFSYYGQDNNHSAVTGGTGTEQLSVYTQTASLDDIKDSVRTFHFDIGIDVITSASTDNIDFAVSSASYIDNRIHFNVGYNRYLKNKRTMVGLAETFSVESDYLSLGQSFLIRHQSKDASQEFSAALDMYYDDQRWGWYDNGTPQILIYPVELRNVSWFNIFKRYSYNLMLGYYKILNSRMTLGLYPGMSYQTGLLSTPFHRVYFNDGSERVENMPRNRLKIPLGVQLNTFIGSRWILRTYYRYYHDDFGIDAHTLNLEAAVKLNGLLTLTPFLRLYTQTQAQFFHPYKDHDPAQGFYTSDYDLSKFQSYKTGLSLRYAPYAIRKRVTFNAIELRYAFYQRSDGLTSNMISLFLNFDRAGN